MTSDVQRFDGLSSVEEFEGKFLMQSCYLDWNEKKQAEKIKFFLKGKALEVYSSSDRDEQEDIAIVFKKLKEGCMQNSESLLTAFYSP